MTYTKPAITKIRAYIPNTDKICDIDVAGRNVIITGANGSGKTQLLRKIFATCQENVNNSLEHPSIIQATITNIEDFIKSNSPANPAYDSHIQALQHQRARLEETINPSVIIDNAEQYIVDHRQGKAVLIFFEATRQATIRESSGSISKDRLIQQGAHSGDPATLFEDYLVSQKTAQAYAESPNIGNDQRAAYVIRQWFEKLESDFRNLFEDQSLSIVFDSNKQCFWVCQREKKPFRLQNLSSGFSSILAVYASLLMKTELSDILPEDMYGIVIIDEIDAHLHVSLQRKIFSFLSDSFPNIQFIVTTHSPFIVSSVSNAVIYDITELQQVEDLSMFSYESVLSGLFNTPPVSKLVTDKVNKIYDILDLPSPDLQLLETLIREASEHESMLDPKSAMHLKRARLFLHKLMGDSPDV